MNKSFTPSNVRNPLAKWQWWCRNRVLRDTRKRLKNNNFSIISCNCLGAMITHDLLQPQLSPTVNLFIKADDYIRFLSNLKEYLKMDMVQVVDDSKPYPVGMVGDVRLYFVHYKTFDDAKKKWQERCRRIKWDNLYIIFSERDGCTYEHLIQFDELPYEHKIVFVHTPCPEIKSSYYFSGFENKGEVGDITDFKGFLGRRKYDKWDYVSFLNIM